MKKEEKNLICLLASELIKVYEENGNTIQDYFKSIVLPDLTESEYKILKKFSEWDV